MNKYFLCTLGTSIAKELKDDLTAKQKAPGAWNESDDGFSRRLDAVVSEAIRDKSSVCERCAEASVLHKANAGPDDRIVLLATDTGLGRVCGEATKRLLVSGFGFHDANVEIVRIPGLQVANAESLRREGLPGFVKAVVTRIEANQGSCDIFLCPVGGYKGIVPFLTALGMAYRLPVLYTFEFIDSLVRLPPLPFTLDRDLYARAKDALREIGSRTEMPEREFLSKIIGYEEEERDTFLAFVEPSSTPGFVTSGAFTETFAPDFERTSAPISPKALEDLDILSHGRWYRTACRVVMDVQDAKVRSEYRGNHKKVVSTDLQILKQGNSSIRLLGYESAGRFFVCRVFAHGDYDKTLDSRSCWRKDFPPEIFVEWSMPPEVLPDSVKNEESPFEAAMRRLSQLEGELQSVVSEWASRVAEQKMAREASEKGLKTLSKTYEKLRQDMQGREREIEALTDQLAAARQRERELAAHSAGEQQAAREEARRLHSQLADLQATLARERQEAESQSSELRILLDHAESARRKEEDEHIAKYEESLRTIEDLRRRLRSAQTRLAMAPHDAEAVQAADREIAEKKKQLASALETLLMSDTTEVPMLESEKFHRLQTELREVKAQLTASADTVRMLENENASLSAALRDAHDRLSEISRMGFGARMRFLLSGHSSN